MESKNKLFLARLTLIIEQKFCVQLEFEYYSVSFITIIQTSNKNKL